VLDEYTPVEVRYYLTATHYRSSLTFTVDQDNGSRPVVRGMEDARGALARLRRAVGPEPLDPAGDLEQASVEAFTAAMDADFNTPDALAVIFDLAREVNRRRDAGAEPAEFDRGRRTFVRLLDVLGIGLGEASSDQQPIEPFVELALDLRRKLRDIRQWALADEVRDRLKTLGVIVEDKPGGGSDWRLER
jgi:cysteinyl-tRNA synthetase